MLCGSLDGRRVWGGMNTYIYMAESLPSSPEIITMLLIGYTLLENKTFKLKKRKKCSVERKVGVYSQVLTGANSKFFWCLELFQTETQIGA